MEKRHYIYIVECADETLYTGYATDPEKRVHQHNHSKVGAKYTRARRPVVLKYTEVFDTRSEACKRECQIKRLSREAKCRLIDSHSKTIK